MTEPRSIAFHSYKGGTGKTTIATNLAAILTAQGHKVVLLDFDVYAPSLQGYFQVKPDKWLNDLLLNNAKVEDVLIDMTPMIKKLSGESARKNGRLWIGFSNPQKEEVYKLEGTAGQSEQSSGKIQLLRRFIQLREDILVKYDADFVILDTSPGIRYWSINSLAIADILLLTLKFGDQDIEGTRRIASDIYTSFEKFGAKPYLLLNRVNGYCIPNTLILPHSHEMKSKTGGDITVPQLDERDLGSALSAEVSISLLSTIPCYCDIQFSRKEFLSALQYPDHPFARHIEKLASGKPFKD